jgi:hypothetical protein
MPPTHAAIAETLARIAQDERQHAELAWDVLRWCVERGGVAVAIAVRRAAAALTVPGSPLAVQLAPEVLRQWGYRMRSWCANAGSAAWPTCKLASATCCRRAPPPPDHLGKRPRTSMTDRRRGSSAQPALLLAIAVLLW